VAKANLLRFKQNSLKTSALCFALLFKKRKYFRFL